MMLQRLKKILVCVALFTFSAVYAVDAEEHTGFLPTDSLHASWVFSGVVENEEGERYGYFFQMDRNEQAFHVVSALFDGQNKSVILQEEGTATISDPASYNWHVGRAFLRFNPINDSWIFGVKTNDKKGFNFKVDILKEQEHRPKVQNLRKGVEFLISQTGQLNGHIQVGDEKEQFVTAKNAWFREIWLSKDQNISQSYSGVLCYFNDGSGFYSVNLMDSDAVRGAQAGLLDKDGRPASISQFIHVKQSPDDGPWHIRIGSPNLDLALSQYLTQESAISGFVVEETKLGFCLLSHNALNQTSVMASAS